MLAPALQKLVELPDWAIWTRSLLITYPFPEDAAKLFEEQSKWVGVPAFARRLALHTPLPPLVICQLAFLRP